MRMKPALHEDFEIDQKVTIDLDGLKATGTIIGISSAHIIFSYIVLFDEPLKVPDYDKLWKAVTIFGGQLKKI